ncbi:amidohydrolase [Streptomyces fuscigenes]|uniref:amidohydrolase n=1 Tax=Streptomyces fuscigenes TaxID=1528880 RepID=UPI001F2A3AAB|nr:amidohydrolase [Streptomyces fuscigenes]MCF3962875.1 amidohydrolase [Streptomyces fuscigenes]
MERSIADLVFAGGPVYVGDGPRTRADFVAVRGGRIVAVGRGDARAREYVGASTEVVPLRGRLLIPSFQDAHVHPVGGGTELGQCDLAGLTTRDEYLRVVAAYAGSYEGPWITGGGWALEAFPASGPTREALDAVVPDRPVYLLNRDHHGAWVNSRALELAGVDRNTPEPVDGRIEREADGSPSGMLQEGAMALVGALLPPRTDDEHVEALLRAQRLLHSLGVTAWQDAIIGTYANMSDPTAAYVSAIASGTLTMRVVGALWWDRTRGAEQIPELVARRDAARAHGLDYSTVKIMLDGIAENGTAAMLGPYRDRCGHPTGNSGISFVPPSELAPHVAALDALDFQTHFHALGDRAVRDALDAVEAARRANGMRDTRPHLAHLQVVDPADVPRFARLGATANLQALWAAHEPQMDDLTLPFLAPERAARQYPFGDLLRAGTTLAAGSDWPVSSPDPLAAIHVAVNRTLRHAPEGTPAFLPGQRLDFGTALAAYTSGSAYVNHLDDTGTIARGNLADLVVLDRDPFAAPPAEVADTRVMATYVGGRRVYAAPDA